VGFEICKRNALKSNCGHKLTASVLLKTAFSGGLQTAHPNSSALTDQSLVFHLHINSTLHPRFPLDYPTSHQIFVLFFKTGFLCSPGCPGTHSVDQAGLELRNPPASAPQMLKPRSCLVRVTSLALIWLYKLFIYVLGCEHAHAPDLV
jgi:hypothetical protein